MRVVALLFVAVLVVLAGCGESDDDSPQAGPAASEAASMDSGSSGQDEGGAGARGGAAGGKDGTSAKGADADARPGTTVTLGDSEFGRMLFGSDDQAIYIFENDDRNETNCSGECAQAWPPVYTEGEPRAGEGVDQSLLGTLERDDGRLQVTYDGQPLYFYANEGPGEVRCHNVNLNGGFWWAVGPDGVRLP